MAKLLLLDGAMGTMLQQRGLAPGMSPSIFALKNPEAVKAVHKEYIKAGSDVILTNTFSANAEKLEGTGVTVEEAIRANVKLAKDVAKKADRKIKVALDIGPIGMLMEPYGSLTFERAYDVFAEIVKAGDKAGADIIYFETMSSLQELRAGILAAKENSKLPVWTTMSFEESGRTFIGTTVESFAITVDALGVDALGFNCSLGPNELLEFAKVVRKWTDKPLIIKPNAGLPDPVSGEYKLNAKAFAKQMKAFEKVGVFAMGGCCGTTPEYIKELSKLRIKNVPCKKVKTNAVCSAMSISTFGKINVVGERLNPTGKKKLQEALLSGDMNYVMSLAIEQEEAGADILDINVGVPGANEPELMKQVVKAVQSVVNIPLQIDSSNAEAIEAGLRVYEGKAIVNSVDASDEKLKKILPIVKKYGAAVVGLTMDKGGVPKTACARFNFAKKIFDSAKKCGIKKEDIIIDCLTLTISAEQKQAKETLSAMQMVKKLGLRLTLGVSNISFGLPERMNVNKSFLASAISCGLDFPIINPNSKEMMDVIYSMRALSGEDASCEKYIERFASETKDVNAVAVNESCETIGEAVKKGLKEKVKELTEKLLLEKDELTIVNEILIPALDEVGKEYESGKLFLPQLINSANAACAGFDVIKEKIASRGGDLKERGTIILATVEGDIHDIGKNIVKVVLENYGFKVIDLGKDVAPEVIVKKAKTENIKLVGLSALMTTTVPAMERTIELLKREEVGAIVMVGGAVLTADYAKKIGADFYTKDATASVRVAEEIFGKGN